MIMIGLIQRRRRRRLSSASSLVQSRSQLFKVSIIWPLMGPIAIKCQRLACANKSTQGQPIDFLSSSSSSSARRVLAKCPPTSVIKLLLLRLHLGSFAPSLERCERAAEKLRCEVKEVVKKVALNRPAKSERFQASASIRAECQSGQVNIYYLATRERRAVIVFVFSSLFLSEEKLGAAATSRVVLSGLFDLPLDAADERRA